MTWPDAQSWASSLQVGGFTGWRLPITAIPDASCGASNGYPAVYSQGYDIGCTGSEMGHLFNVSLGNVPDAPISNTGNFGNVQNYYYWSGTPVASNSYYVWTYQTSINGQGYTGTGTNPFFSFAVRDGDVIAATTSTTTTTTTTTTSTTSTSQAPTTTTTVATTTTTTLIPGGEQIALDLPQGWNLIGNGHEIAFDVAAVFADTTTITTVWKWLAAKTTWAFYAPALTAQTLIDYTVSKGYEVLSSIQAGEGYWVNTKQAVTVNLPSATPIASNSFNEMGSRPLGQGWSLIATGDNPTPGLFNSNLGTTPPSPGTLATNLTSLWAWDPKTPGWYFWAPSLVNSGTLGSYITGKGYLDFGILPGNPTGTISPQTGVWVNRP
jgi:hypothetical protein